MAKQSALRELIVTKHLATAAIAAVTITLKELPYVVQEIQDYFDGKTIAALHEDSFSIVLPKIGVASGTTVVRLVKR